MFNEIISHYWKNPPNKLAIKWADIRYWEENWLCWDSLEVFIKLEWESISDWAFEWNTSIITTACASAFWESIVWKTTDEVLNLGYSYMVETLWEDVSPRRKNASVLWLLATRNAIHEFKKDWKIDNFDDLINS